MITTGRRIVEYYRFTCNVCGINSTNPHRFIHGFSHPLLPATFPKSIDLTRGKNAHNVQICKSCAAALQEVFGDDQDNVDALLLENNVALPKNER